MNVLWLSWKDRGHPQAGGAETVSGEIMDRLARDGHSVKHVTAMYAGAAEKEVKNGVQIIRGGGRFTVYAAAKKRYLSDLKDWPDIIIDEMNTLPFGSAFYSTQKNMLLCYQLAREVWLYQMFAPVSWIGYAFEPLMLRRLARKYPLTATESDSTKADLMRYGFKNVHTFKVGMAQKPIQKVEAKKGAMVLSLGSVRPMKRTLDAIKAFEIARDSNDSLTMVVAGDNSGDYGQKVTAYAKASRHAGAIQVVGRVSSERRLALMRQASVILVSSVKEGWGLIVTEANSQGTPAIGYNADGLRDSIQSGKTGVLVPNGDYAAMGGAINNLLANREQYKTMQHNAWQWSKQFTFENSYKDFLALIGKL